MNNELNITWCFPDLLNLHGDRGNILALEKVAKLLDLNVKVNKVINLGDEIDFENSDILFFNPGELKLVKPIIDALTSYKEQLEKYIENNKVIVLIGTSGAIFAKNIKRLNEEFDGLGFLDMTCKERETVYGDDIIFRLNSNDDIEINGNQIQIIDTYLNDDISLGTLQYGRGNNGDEHNLEGATYKNVIFTNTLGPIFVKNPWYAEKIIKDAMEAKGVKIEKIIESKEFELEYNSLECIKRYNEKKVKN